MAPQVGLEPTTLRLTARRQPSAALLGIARTCSISSAYRQTANPGRAHECSPLAAILKHGTHKSPKVSLATRLRLHESAIIPIIPPFPTASMWSGAQMIGNFRFTHSCAWNLEPTGKGQRFSEYHSSREADPHPFERSLPGARFSEFLAHETLSAPREPHAHVAPARLRQSSGTQSRVNR